MWLIDFIPASMLHLLVLASIVGIVLSTFIPTILFPEPYKTATKIICIMVALFGLYTEGGISEKAKWEQRVAEQNAKIAQLMTESEKVTTKEVIKYVDRIKVVKEKGDVIIKEVPIYITKEADANCTITNGFVLLHNAAAEMSVPPTAGDFDAPAADVTLSGVGKVVAQNYGICHETATQLEALQNWVREQEKLFNK